MRKIIYPYKMGSRSGRAISRELNAVRVYPNRRYKPRKNDIIICWGNTKEPAWVEQARERGVKMLNPRHTTANAVNKFKTLQILRDHGIATPDFTQDITKANEWEKVVARERLDDTGGRGVVVCEGGDLPRASLYTEYIPQKAEYRVHVFDGKVIDYAKKRRRRGDEPSEEESAVRSYQNGWIFSRHKLRRLERIENIAIEAVRALGLDFGGVDVVMGENGDVYVLEVNTACGLSESGIISYVSAINNYA